MPNLVAKDMLLERYLPRTMGGQPLITCITHLFLSLDSVSLGVANQCAYADDMPMSTRIRAHANFRIVLLPGTLDEQIWREDAGPNPEENVWQGIRNRNAIC